MKKLILNIMTVLLLTTTAFADSPKTLNYQGRLMNTAGQPVIDGQYSVTFRLYTAASGGTQVWEEAQSVMANNGYFNTTLGNSTVLNPSIFNQPLWVGIQVGTEAEMTPRQKLGTTAYAMTVVDGAITTGKIVNQAVTKEKILGSIISQVQFVKGTADDTGTTAESKMEKMEITTTTTSDSLLEIDFQTMFHTSQDATVTFRLYYSNNQTDYTKICQVSEHVHASDDGSSKMKWMKNVAAGTHTLQVKWKTSAGTVSIKPGSSAQNRMLIVKELSL
jgi:hypothetical protein